MAGCNHKSEEAWGLVKFYEIDYHKILFLFLLQTGTLKIIDRKKHIFKLAQVLLALPWLGLSCLVYMNRLGLSKKSLGFGLSFT